MPFQIHSMRFYRLFFFRFSPFLFTVLILHSCKAPLYEMKWQSKPVVADGNPQEWKIPLRFYDSKSKLSYTVTNDLKNLYICVRVTDDAGQMKVMRAGMQIWIDSTGKNNEAIGILFPQRVQAIPVDGTQPEHDRAESGSRKSGVTRAGNSTVRNHFLHDYKEMMLTGFHAPIRGSVPLNNEFGIQLGINWDASRYDSSFIMIYEAVIPFKTFYKNELSLADSTKQFGISIVVNALPAPKQTGGAHSGGGAHGGGGGGMNGGMRGGSSTGGRGGRGGGQQGGGQPANPLYVTDKIKMRMQLAVKPEPPSPVDLFNK
jgi:hypothetical protein